MCLSDNVLLKYRITALRRATTTTETICEEQPGDSSVHKIAYEKRRMGCSWVPYIKMVGEMRDVYKNYFGKIWTSKTMWETSPHNED